ncbi:MAG: hypothetical protein K9K36_07145 [Desulfarculaceae bacterium]|nr:hypothetical protein [Desulfarculaceae bacterium]MCF8124504.1 hypothetical protein [Desulfarculaceae bacterium]
MSGYSQIRGDQLWYRLAQAGVGANARNLFFFLLAPANERPVAGVRRFLPNEPLTFMPDWEQGTATEALSALERAGLVAYDRGTALIFVPLLLEMQPCKGANAVNGAAAAIESLPDSPVMVGALEHLAMAADEAGRVASLRADGLQDGAKKESAQRSAEQLAALAEELRERAGRVANSVTPSEGGPEGVRRGVQGGLRIAEPPSEGVPRARGRACAPYPDPHPDPEPKLSGEDPPKRAPPFLGKHRTAKSGGKRGR